MLAFLPSWIRGPLAMVLVLLNLVFWIVPLFAVALVKLLLSPIAATQRAFRLALIWIAEHWISGNNLVTDLTQKIEWDVQLPDDLDRRGAYFVVANHQSWADIVVLQRIFNRRIPFLKFFLKQQLLYVPLLGLAWWALDFPFMRRYSREYLARHPEKRGTDMEVTRKACAKFHGIPVSVTNFVEGTRFTPAKRERQDSPYRNLLKPRAGGLAFALNAMQGSIRTLLDVTIVYDPHRATLGDMFAGRVQWVSVRVHERPVPEQFLHGDYESDREWRIAFQAWLRDCWERKDEEISRLQGA